ncbi:MAG: hypothetical protein AAF557_21970 [Pseudomonadota bacterium]
MILGRMEITPRAVETHKDSYLLGNLSVVSVRRPFLPIGVLAVIGGGAFCLSFGDLLYAYEIAVIGMTALSLLVLGLVIGQIQLLSRDLRGTELSGMIWGSFGHLNRIRREIVAAMREVDVSVERRRS